MLGPRLRIAFVHQDQLQRYLRLGIKRLDLTLIIRSALNAIAIREDGDGGCAGKSYGARYARAFRGEKQSEVSINECTRARVHARARVRFSTSVARPTVSRALH